MSPQRIGGIALVVVGMILFIVGLKASDSISDRLSSFFTGHFTDSTVWYMVAGVVSLVVGVLLASFGGRKASA